MLKEKSQHITTHPIIVPTKLGNLQTLNCYLVEINNELILIDAADTSEQSWNTLLNVLENNYFILQDITKIILTHNHADHIGLVNRIRTKAPHIQLYAHEDAFVRLRRDTEFLHERISFFEKLYKEMGCGNEVQPFINRMYQSIEKNAHQAIEGEILPLKDGDFVHDLQVIEGKGHAPEHIFLWHENTKEAYVGDLIIEHSPSNALIEMDKNGQRTKSLITYEQSLQKLRSYDANIAYSGHGSIIDHPNEVIDDKLKRMQLKSEKIFSLLDEPKTAAQITKQFYKERYESLLPLVMSEVIGHLDRLENRNYITSTYKQDLLYYKKI